MSENRKSGIALIAGSVGGILTMSMHPAATASLSAEEAARLIIISGTAHAIAIVSVVVLFLGTCGLAKSIDAADRLSFAGVATFGFACVAVLIAATVSGFIIPALMKHMVRDAPGNAHEWRVVIDGIFQINQAFGRIYSVGASVAIILWSVSVLRNGGFGRGIAIYGCIVSTLIVVGISTGHLRLDIHGMAVIWLCQAIWFILAGSQLCSRTLSRLGGPRWPRGFAHR